jgi:hypothetical protein
MFAPPLIHATVTDQSGAVELEPGNLYFTTEGLLLQRPTSADVPNAVPILLHVQYQDVDRVDPCFGDCAVDVTYRGATARLRFNDADIARRAFRHLVKHVDRTAAVTSSSSAMAAALVPLESDAAPPPQTRHRSPSSKWPPAGISTSVSATDVDPLIQAAHDAQGPRPSQAVPPVDTAQIDVALVAARAVAAYRQCPRDKRPGDFTLPQSLDTLLTRFAATGGFLQPRAAAA